MTRFTARGTWPGAVTLRAGWNKAAARPWNDDLPDAVVRLERGGSEFLARCVSWLAGRGVPAIYSPPLFTTNLGIWTRAGFEPDLELSLLERDVSLPVTLPERSVRPGEHAEWGELEELDRLAFDLRWRVGALGLTDAVEATPRAEILVVDGDGFLAGFAIVGSLFQTAYLQRLGVRPDHQGRGIGRSLLRAAVLWARGRQARTMLLNTQTDNLGATALYRSEGFELMPERLKIMRCAGATAP